MRVLLTTDTIGGVWTFTRELSHQLLDSGHEVALVSFGRLPSRSQAEWSNGVAAAYGDRFTFRASEAPLEWMQNNDAAFTGGVDLLLQIIQEFKPQVLHANQFCWGALNCGLPKLITAHSDVMSWADVCQPELLQQDTPWLKQYRKLVQYGLDGTDAVVAPTRWMRAAVLKHFHVLAQFGVIPNGRAVQPVPALRMLQAVSVGRLWDAAKGMQTLLEFEPPMPVLIAGEERFESAGATTGKLQVLGVLKEAELISLFSQSSVYIATSVYEPFGLAPLEAALCGCAVIARYIPSLREVWSDAALYFTSAAELQEHLTLLAKDPSALEAAQTAAQERAQTYSARNMASQYLAAYQALLDASSNAHDSRTAVAHAA